MNFLITLLLTIGTINAFITRSKIPSSLFTRLFSDVASPYQVFIGNLPFDVSKDSLQNVIAEHSSTFQDIRLIINKETGQSRGFAFIDYPTKEEAEGAASALAGIEINGRSVKVDSIGQKVERAEGEAAPRRERADRPPRTPRGDTFSVFVGNLDFTVTEDDLASIIAEEVGEGKVVSVRVGRDRETGRSKGYAHLDCSNQEAATEIVSKMSGYMISDRPLKTDFAEKSDKRDSPRSASREGGMNSMRGTPAPSVYIANLAWDITPELVEDMVNDVVGPNVFLRVRLAVDRETGKPRGFGHIDMVSQEAAERAVRELNGMEVMGRQIRADFATSSDKSKRPPSGGARGGTGGRSYANKEEEGSFGSWA